MVGAIGSSILLDGLLDFVCVGCHIICLRFCRFLGFSLLMVWVISALSGGPIAQEGGFSGHGDL